MKIRVNRKNTEFSRESRPITQKPVEQPLERKQYAEKPRLEVAVAKLERAVAKLEGSVIAWKAASTAFALSLLAVMVALLLSK